MKVPCDLVILGLNSENRVLIYVVHHNNIIDSKLAFVLSEIPAKASKPKGTTPKDTFQITKTKGNPPQTGLRSRLVVSRIFGVSGGRSDREPLSLPIRQVENGGFTRRTPSRHTPDTTPYYRQTKP